MKRGTVLKIALLASVVALAACGSDDNKIGSTVKGERIAVIEQSQAIEADKALQGTKPSLSKEVVNFSWPQAGYDSEHAMPNAQGPLHPKIVWKSTIGKGSNSSFKLLASPVIDRGFIYTMDAQGLVRSFDAKTGDKRWQIDTTPKDSDGPAIGGGLALDGDTLYATTGFGDVFALQAKNGETKWKKPLLKPLRAAPVVYDGRVFVVSIDNDLNTLSAATGDVLWHHAGITESATLMGASSPAVEGDGVIVAYNSGEIFSLRPQNGRASWNYSLAVPAQVGALPAIADIRGLPVIEGGRLYAISHSGRVAALDQRSGDRLWENDIGGINTPIVSGDAVFVYGGDSQLIAMTKASGRTMWAAQLPKRVDPNDKNSDILVWTGPVLASGRLWMVNSEGELTGFSAEDGSLIEKIDIGAPMYLSPIVADRTIYVLTDSGKLIALR